MTCILCHLTKGVRHFSKDSPICKECIDQLETAFNVDYAPPKKVTKIEGYIRLLSASRTQAIEEEELKVWEKVFIHSKPWKLLWVLLRENDLFS